MAQLLGAASAQPPRVTGKRFARCWAKVLVWLASPLRDVGFWDLIPEALGWLNGRGAVAEEGERYALIRLFSAPAVLVTYVMVGT